MTDALNFVLQIAGALTTSSLNPSNKNESERYKTFACFLTFNLTNSLIIQRTDAMDIMDVISKVRLLNKASDVVSNTNFFY